MRASPVLASLLLLLAGSAAAAPAYTADGELIPPADYRSWVFLGAGLDMNYAAEAAGQPAASRPHMFDNVFVDPAAWAAFQKTGAWPDKTVFVTENRLASSEGSINKAGQFQSERVVGMEMHVRDDARFKGGWGFFASNGKPAPLIPYTAACYSCHQDHGAVQTTFVQFYPTAKPIAQKAGTYTER
jgi:hypothetical protein